MMNYSDSNSIEEFSISPRMSPNKTTPSIKSLGSNYSASASQSRYNQLYEKKKKQKLLKHRIKSNTEKYLPPNLRSPTSKNTENDAPKIKPYSIALKSPNIININNNKKDNNTMSKIVIDSRSRINNLKVIGSEPDTARSTYQDIKALAIQQSYNLHTSSEREIALKRMIGASSTRPNRLVLHPTGTLPIYQTDGFSYEQRTSCMVITGGAVVSAMVICITILAFMGYSG